MIKKSIASSIIMAVFFIIGVCGQNSKSSLLDQKVTVKLENAPFWQFTNFLTRTLKVPIGFEESDHDTTHSDYDFDPNTPSIFGEPKNRGRVTFIGVDIKVNAVGHLLALTSKP
ncbi:MAG: hypothetical protein IPJ30_16275 [Acidobacteria bacterium]|nr:hypothetical protein [Acidobacteriota bacterium]